MLPQPHIALAVAAESPARPKRNPLIDSLYARRCIASIIAVFDHPLVRAYSRIRFLILRQRFLNEIGQYLPEHGTVVDIGCGFGLFALYFAMINPKLEIHGVDLNAKRIFMAQTAAKRLGLKNVQFSVGDAARYACDFPIDGAYMLDIIHHIPRKEAPRLIREISAHLEPGARLIIKDVDSTPYFKMLFTWALDKLMDFKTPISYWSQAEFHELMETADLATHSHAMVDILPYPHMIYVGSKVSSRRAPGPDGCSLAST